MQSVYCVNLLSLSLLSALMTTACADNGITHQYPDMWCEHNLCDYRVVEGDIKPVPTWNKSDHGIELVGSLVEIEHTRYALEWSSYNEGNVTLEMIAYIEPSAEVTLEVDYWDDGHIDCTHKLAESNWESLRLTVEGPPDYESIRFVVRKKGKGRVVIAQLKPWQTSTNDPRDHVVICESSDYKAPIGYPCESDDECVSGKCSPTMPEEYEAYLTQQCGKCADNKECPIGSLCEENISLRCSECKDDSDCPEGDICGLRTVCDEGIDCTDFFTTDHEFSRKCMSPGLYGTGHGCYKDSECTSDFCVSWFDIDGFIGPDIPGSELV